MEYFLTFEFWWNMLCGTVASVLLTVSIFSAVCAVVSLFSSESEKKEIFIGGILFAVVFFFLGRCFFEGGIKYVYWWEENRGPVIILAKEAPLLHNYFLALERSLSHTNEQIRKLDMERGNSTTTEARKVYEKQIAQQESRKQELENMKCRIKKLAQRLYFSKYLARMGHLSADRDVERELREVQAACEQLVNEG